MNYRGLVRKIESDEIVNNAGGAAFQLNKWQQLERFIVIGSHRGTYYVTPRKLTMDNLGNIIDCIAEDADRVVSLVLDISDGGKAPSNDPALLVLAACMTYADLKIKNLAASLLPKIARTATHLFHFLEYVEQLRGWGRLLRRAVANWYTDKPVESLGLQVVKYRSRDGWTHRDAIRLSHPKPTSEIQENLLKFAIGKYESGVLPDIVNTYLEASKITDSYSLVGFIHDKIKAGKYITWELLPNHLIKDKYVWSELLPVLPYTAMLRNLRRMFGYGTFDIGNNFEYAKDFLTNERNIYTSRVHPMAILSAISALNTDMLVSSDFMDCLELAFFTAFRNVEPTNKRMMLALDVSGSMAVHYSNGFSPIEAAVAMAKVTQRVEKNALVKMFDHRFSDVPFKQDDGLYKSVKSVIGLDFGATDCALPMLEAAKHSWPVDAFVVYTDSETWYGDVTPREAIRRYRNTMGIPAKLIVVGMTATDVTIADPNDRGMLDCAGFDTQTPSVISWFVNAS